MPGNKCLAEGATAGAVLVWDGDGTPNLAFERTVLWRGFGEKTEGHERCISIPVLVEKTADALRSQYLAWIFALGEAEIQGKRAVEHLLIRQQLSFWWLGSPAQKFNISAKSLVPDAIKLLALEKLLLVDGADSILLISDNAPLADCLGAYAKTLKIDFEWRRLSHSQDYPLRQKSIYLRLSPVVRAFVSLARFCITRLPAALRHTHRSSSELADVSFFDVLVHLEKSAFETGRFVSNYWSSLVQKLSDSGVRTNWFHIFHPQPAIPTMAEAASLVERFERNADGWEFHGVVDILPPVSTLFRAVRDFMLLQRAVRKIDGFQSSVVLSGSALNLWPLLADEWRESLTGPAALMECLRIGLFERVLSRVPRQRMGIYICENQPWEMALIHAWRSNGHGQLIAVPHSTIRYWDLRYFYDPRSYDERSAQRLPMPDLYALNGPVAKATALSGGYPAERIVEVEALRYLHLAAYVDAESGTTETLRVLVCGDFDSSTNDLIFKWLAGTVKALEGKTRYIFKPHPAFPYRIDSDFLASVELLVDERPLSKLLQRCDVVVTSAITSAAVDAYCAGKNVVQILDGGRLNANALRGVAGVCQVRTIDEFADALRQISARQVTVPLPYFLLDPSLPAWQNVILPGKRQNEVSLAT